MGEGRELGKEGNGEQSGREAGRRYEEERQGRGVWGKTEIVKDRKGKTSAPIALEGTSLSKGDPFPLLGKRNQAGLCVGLSPKQPGAGRTPPSPPGKTGGQKLKEQVVWAPRYLHLHAVKQKVIRSLTVD